jgi:D-tyrosyl-tRNA(Tyr) deacylase
MRVIVQRVSSASVSINASVISNISSGLLLLIGIETSDSEEDLQWLCKKIANMRIFNDEDGVMNRSLIDTKGDAIVVSQFTLHASTKKGNRPSYIKAARPDHAIPLYEKFIDELEIQLNKKVGSGKFGAMMEVELVNDGPVTIIIDSKRKD